MKDVLKSLNSKKILNILVILSPFIDLFISLIMYKFNKFSFIGSLIRGIILLLFLIYVLVLDKKKNNKIYNYILIIGVYSAIFLFNRFLIFPNFFTDEFVSVIKYMFFPLILACTLTIESDIKNNNIFYYTALLYMAFLFIPTVTNTGILSYANGKNGNIGWFYSPNEISSIISILSPFVIVKVFNNEKIKNKIFPFIMSIIYIYTAINIGTKTPILAIFITLVVLLIINIIQNIYKRSIKNNLANIFIIIIYFLALTFSLSNSKMFDNLKTQVNIYYKVVLKYLNLNEKDDVNGTTENNKPSKSESNKPSNSENSKPSNSENSKPSEEPNDINNNEKEITIGKNDMLLLENEYSLFNDVFVEKNTLNYKSNKFLNILLSSRDIYLMQKVDNLENYNVFDYLIGIGKNQKIYGEISSKNIEMDFLDILFNFGIIGFIIYYALIVYVLFKLIIYFISNFKKIVFDYEFLALYLSVILSFVISTLSGHTMGAPSVSFMLAVVLSTSYKKCYRVKLNENIKYKKSFLISFVSLAVLTSFVYLINKQVNKEYELNIVFDKDYKVVNTNLKNELIIEKNIESEFATDNIKVYVISDNGKEIFRYLTVDRKTDNNINYKFFTGKNMTYKKMNVNTSINNNYDNYVGFEEYETVKKYSTTVGYDKLTLPSYYTCGDNKSMLVHKTYVYKYKIKQYKNGDSSQLKELKNEIAFNNNVNSYELQYKGMVDQTIIVSENNLFESKDDIKEFVNLINNGKMSSWLSYDGSYTKLPYSIEPYTTEGYGRNLGNIADKKVFATYQESNNNFYKSIISSTLHTLDNYLPRYKQGVWLSEYTSTWLKKDYNTSSLYFDTRHNDNLRIYFSLVNDIYKSSTLKEWENYYVDFMVGTYNLKKYNKFSYGILAADYYTNHTNDKNTHSSLNHQLAIINSLLEMYNKTKNNQYKNVAFNYLNTVINIGEKWIKEDDDLWYEIKPDGTMSGTDYKTLTLEDLLTTQKYLIEIKGEKDETLDKLINSKVKYLNSINYKRGSLIDNKLKEGDYIE